MTMLDRYSAFVRRLRDAVLESGAVTDRATRSAIEAYAASAGGRPGPASKDVKTDIRQYVDKVARFAYKVTDEDVQALRRAGYSEDAIFEITASAALGAGMGRLERAYAALKAEV
jgi:hypothetical protein